MACVAPFTFDIFLFELLSPLLAGGTSELVSLRPVLDLDRLMASLEVSTRLHAVPTLLRQVVERARPEPGRYGRLRTLFVGGDAVPAELLRDAAEVFPRARIHVLYGPTEGTVLASSHAVPAGSVRPLLGRPLASMRLSVRDDAGAPAPVGVAGELWIGGRGVSRGYLHRPELTAEKYVPSARGRWYRTGDRARWLGDGTLEFLGRVDQQVKVRGFRIEPGEVESVLAAQPGARRAVVVARGDGAGSEKRLVAYLEGEGVDVAAARAALRASLPDYMVPSVFVVLASLPLTAHGKVDRAALPAPEAPVAGRIVAPRTEPERVLARIWSEVLGVAEVGVEDNFFDLGGDSILTIQILAKAERAGLHLTPRQMFEHQTVAALAAAAVARQAPVGEQELVTGSAPLTPVQELFFETGPEPKSRLIQSLLFEIAGPLGQADLEAAMARLVFHHDALRLRFTQDGERWFQRHGEALGDAASGGTDRPVGAAGRAPERSDRGSGDPGSGELRPVGGTPGGGRALPPGRGRSGPPAAGHPPPLGRRRLLARAAGGLRDGCPGSGAAGQDDLVQGLGRAAGRARPRRRPGGAAVLAGAGHSRGRAARQEHGRERLGLGPAGARLPAGRADRGAAAPGSAGLPDPHQRRAAGGPGAVAVAVERLPAGARGAGGPWARGSLRRRRPVAHGGLADRRLSGGLRRARRGGVIAQGRQGATAEGASRRPRLWCPALPGGRSAGRSQRAGDLLQLPGPARPRPGGGLAAAAGPGGGRHAGADGPAAAAARRGGLGGRRPAAGGLDVQQEPAPPRHGRGAGAELPRRASGAHRALLVAGSRRLHAFGLPAGPARPGHAGPAGGGASRTWRTSIHCRRCRRACSSRPSPRRERGST